MRFPIPFVMVTSVLQLGGSAPAQQLSTPAPGAPPSGAANRQEFVPTPVKAMGFKMNLDARKWVVDFQKGSSGRMLLEFVPEGQKITAWKEMVAQQIDFGPFSLDEYYLGWKAMLLAADPKVQIRAERQADGSLLAAYTSIAGDEMGLRRFMKAPDGIYMLAYHVRPKVNTEPVWKLWREILAGADLRPNPVRPAGPVRAFPTLASAPFEVTVPSADWAVDVSQARELRKDAFLVAALVNAKAGLKAVIISAALAPSQTTVEQICAEVRAGFARDNEKIERDEDVTIAGYKGRAFAFAGTRNGEATYTETVVFIAGKASWTMVFIGRPEQKAEVRQMLAFFRPKKA